MFSPLFLLLYLQNNEEAAWELIQVRHEKDQESLLHSFAYALIALRTRHNDEAIEILNSRPKGDEYIAFPFLNYLMGLAKIRKLDENAARHFKTFLIFYKGRNYIKDAYQKLAWLSLIHDNFSLYNTYMASCQSKGYGYMEIDKQAEEEAVSREIPNPILLKARLLSDGGYYEKALALLKGKSTKDFSKKKDRIEFTYRAARIYHTWQMEDKSIPYYEATIKNGENEPYYYAANSALQLGHIFEERNNFEKARQYYQKSLSINGYQYAESLQMKAKAGLNRIEHK